MYKLFRDYLDTGVEPFPDAICGEGYRCSAYLKDGTYLPCVMLRTCEAVTRLALSRFDQERKSAGVFGKRTAYEDIVKHFLTTGNRVNDYDIAKVEVSPYALPLALLKQVEGETTMGWTGFVLEMSNGKLLALGTSFGFEFFNLPQPIALSDVRAVHNHSYVASSGELRRMTQGMSAETADYSTSLVSRERPYFTCYVDGTLAKAVASR